MKIVKDEKYWNDYTDFINEVEKLTELSPAGLISEYKVLIKELNDDNEIFHSEWIHELDYDLLIRQNIQKIIDHKLISRNILFKEFKKKIEKMDLVFKTYIMNPDKIDWWKNPEIKFKRK